ncbi:MAG: DUF1559 domain-containing protein [Gemmataceae bacterium]|nr:DUF1559 domain-containing protein [Gemmataceae bacterium]MDW8264889.1 prepilin-type N-terminal cleavage/methylation domain-containing protein [Gemmataceae bacterium]
MRRISSRMRRGFTLIELLVVIAIIAVLASISVPAVIRALETANRARCTANLSNLGVAAFANATSNASQSFPQGQDSQGNSFYWAIRGEAGVPESNTGTEAVSFFLCPSRGAASALQGPYAHFGYLAQRSVLGFGKRVPLNSITDGADNTFFAGHMAMDPQSYLTSGQPWRTGNFAVNGTSHQKDAVGQSTDGFGSPHASGSPFVFCDRSVKLVRYDVSPQTIQALWTFNGGERLNQQDIDW